MNTLEEKLKTLLLQLESNSEVIRDLQLEKYANEQARESLASELEMIKIELNESTAQNCQI